MRRQKFKVKYFEILFDQQTVFFLPLESKETKDQAWIDESVGEFYFCFLSPEKNELIL